MQTRIDQKKYFNGSVNLEGNLKINQVRCLLRPRSIHLCHQKPNSVRETFPSNKILLIKQSILSSILPNIQEEIE
jgi:hypothetical protein